MGLVCNSCTKDREIDETHSNGKQQVNNKHQFLAEYIQNTRIRQYQDNNLSIIDDDYQILNSQNNQQANKFQEQYNFWKKNKRNWDPQTRDQVVYNLNEYNPINQHINKSQQVSLDKCKDNFQALILHDNQNSKSETQNQSFQENIFSYKNQEMPQKKPKTESFNLIQQIKMQNDLRQQAKTIQNNILQDQIEEDDENEKQNQYLMGDDEYDNNNNSELQNKQKIKQKNKYEDLFQIFPSTSIRFYEAACTLQQWVRSFRYKYALKIKAKYQIKQSQQ
ncbi:hypothetical protein PPERSA_10907 [Pseudocohnilembus persalinus]|uniref:Uncharacterized protein n=1 Tax=Pseudocohnilembus persalinus TaxID=266149 RepID=A0A0V0R9H1_PSEPJ|nr:hypothetical protein PPERSA_10907 [Pseudocohnilembus persalinus]|eukprot:KRX11140.1 hypothetical protein PPERSA_10907 [Pseudocohnilembus persalinus]